jgi:MYXO-CTERM domain-containing protein
VKVGKSELETDDKGKITAAGRKAAVDALDSLPGEEVWPIHIWASLDKGAVGPLYIEFWDKWEGKDIKVPWHYEESGYSGDRYQSFSFDLEGNRGFNAGHTYRIRFVQVSTKGKDVVLAQGAKITLNKVQEAEEEEDGGDEGEGEGEEELSAQDIADSLAGPDEAEVGDGEEEGGEPPETEASKKGGCSVDVTPGLGFSGALVLMGLGAIRRRRQ